MNEKSGFIIRGSYNSCNKLDKNFSDLFYFQDQNQILNQYIENLKYEEIQLKEIENLNVKLLQNIRFFEKKSNFLNIKSSNTTNFIMNNNFNLRCLLNKLINSYNENVYKMDYIRQTINDIEFNIIILKQKLLLK